MSDQATAGNTEKDPEGLSKAEASKRIEELQVKTGRGTSEGDS